MLKTTTNPKLSFRTSALVVTTACLIVGAVELQGLKAKEPVVDPTHQVNAMTCVKCHGDEKTIQMMRMKEDGTNYLFNPDGTFKDPKLAALNPNHPRITGKDPAK
jgi:hypothetical protein